MKTTNELKQQVGQTPANMPDNWEAVTRSQLEWLAEHGSYGQRLIATRYLCDWTKDHK